MNTIYMDNGATSFPKAPQVAASIADFIENSATNSNRSSYALSNETSLKIYEVREKLCRLFHFDCPSNVVFTSGITHSINLLLFGFLKKGEHIIISAMEHNAVYRAASELSKRGVEYSIAPCSKEGVIELSSLKSCLQKNTRLLITLTASNVCGSLQPVYEIGEFCRDNSIEYILDTAQSAGHIELDFYKANISALAFTGHKGLLGPAGIGGFLISTAFANAVSPLFYGGTGSVSSSEDMPKTMPDKFEAGTQNNIGIMGLGTAVDFILSKGTDSFRAHEIALTDLFLKQLCENKNIYIAGTKNANDTVGVISVDFLNKDNALVAFELERKYGILTRAGLHCAPLAHKNIGTFPKGTVRFSFGYTHNISDILYVTDAINQISK